MVIGNGRMDQMVLIKINKFLPLDKLPNNAYLIGKEKGWFTEPPNKSMTAKVGQNGR